jgi:hypothetical protein
MDRYEIKLKENHIKEIEIMKINNENKCKKCQSDYNINVNKAGSCSKGGPHEP